MRFRSTLAFILVSSLCATSALAQPRRARSPKPPNESSAKPRAPEKGGAPAAGSGSSDSPRAADTSGDSAAPAPAEDADPEAPAPESEDLGAPPPAAADASGTKLSPLTPNADEFPAGAPAAAAVDFDRLLGDIAALRSRVAALTTTLFKSKLRVVVEARGSDARVEQLQVTLDDGVVFSAPPRFSAEDEQVVYEHAVAPGQHVVGLELERYDARRREFRSWQSSKFSLVVPDNQTVEAHFVLDDESEMAEDFPDDGDGEYDLRVRLRARVSE